MAADLIRASGKRGFEKFTRQHLRNWEKAMSKDAERASFMSACDEAVASDGDATDSELPRGSSTAVPKAKKRGRKVFRYFESRIISKLACVLLSAAEVFIVRIHRRFFPLQS